MLFQQQSLRTWTPHLPTQHCHAVVSGETHGGEETGEAEAASGLLLGE